VGLSDFSEVLNIGAQIKMKIRIVKSTLAILCLTTFSAPAFAKKIAYAEQYACSGNQKVIWALSWIFTGSDTRDEYRGVRNDNEGSGSWFYIWSGTASTLDVGCRIYGTGNGEWLRIEACDSPTANCHYSSTTVAINQSCSHQY
jgi:hypothetical protein